MESSEFLEAEKQIAQVNVSEMKGKYLTFCTDNQLFGIPISDVVQIVGIQEITEVPEFPRYAKGIINLRGEIIPVMDMRLRLNREEVEYDERTCIIVTKIKDNAVGLIVDEVDEVIAISDEVISSPPKVSEDFNTYLTGFGKLAEQVVLLMNTNKLLGNEEVQLV